MNDYLTKFANKIGNAILGDTSKDHEWSPEDKIRLRKEFARIAKISEAE